MVMAWMHIRCTVLCFSSALRGCEVVLLIVTAAALPGLVYLEVGLDVQRIFSRYGLRHGVPMNGMWR